MNEDRYRKALWVLSVFGPFLTLGAIDRLPRPGLPVEENWRRTKDFAVIMLANIGLATLIIGGQVETKTTAKTAKIKALVPP